jgi:hypothetical protein
MGRAGGLRGRLLASDRREGNWQTYGYEVSTNVIPANNFWFLISDFVNLIGPERS